LPLADTAYGGSAVPVRPPELPQPALEQSYDQYIYYNRALGEQDAYIPSNNERYREAREVNSYEHIADQAMGPYFQQPYESYNDIGQGTASVRMDDDGGVKSSPQLPPKIKQFLQWKAQRGANPKVNCSE
jgi:hypothetical protein